MSYITYSVTAKDLADYYIPKVDVYNLMITSINSIGYGQAIYNFTSTNDNSLNSVEIYNADVEDTMVYVPSTGIWYDKFVVGPELWSVTSQQGLDFLNGTYDIPGLVKLKYCNGCSDRNGLPIPTISSFSNRFTTLKNMMESNFTETGYLFYDLALPQFQNYFKSVVEIGVGTYIFRDWQNTLKSESQVSDQTGISTTEISNSISNAQPILPPKTFNYILSWCCDPNIRTSIQLPYELKFKTIVFKDPRGFSPPCWTVTPTDSEAREIVEFVDEYEFCADCQAEQGLCRR